MSAVVIVGSGVAGITAAETLRTEGFTGSVTVIGDDPAVPYRRPAVSKELLAGSVPAERTWLRPAGYWAERDIDVRTGVAAKSVDPDRRVVELGTGETLGYDALLLATGGRARTIGHDAGDAAFTLRSAGDVAVLRAAIERTNTVLVVGAGLIGSEVAATARGLGAEVTVLETAERPLHRMLPPVIGARYEKLHRDNGVALHTSVRLDELAADGRGGVRAVAEDGRHWSAGAALVAVGSAPDTALAERMGLVVDDGVVVDHRFATSQPGVFAAGDVANTPNPVLGERFRAEHWNTAQAQGAAAARAMLAELTGVVAEVWREVPWCWTSQYGVNLQVAGWPRADDELVVRGDVDGLDFTALTRRAGRLVGAITIGRPKDVRAARILIADQPTIDPAVLADPDVDLTALSVVPVTVG